MKNNSLLSPHIAPPVGIDGNGIPPGSTNGEMPRPSLPQLSFADLELPNRALHGDNRSLAHESGPATTDGSFFSMPGSPGEWVADIMLVAVSVALTLIAATTLFWMLHAWRSSIHLRRTGFPETPIPATHSFTLLVPARHEEEVLGQTLDTLARQEHAAFNIIAIVGDDDPGTAKVAQSAARRHPGRIIVMVDDSMPKNKPKALNRALALAQGDIIGVFDAEDEVHPRLLTLIDSRFTDTGADVVQGGVQLMNFESSWWALRNVLEYYFWFRSRLHFHADSRIIPLGGNTVFIKRSWLTASKGWDAECLAEDCELGIRLSCQGAKVVVAYSPEVVTREETPGSLASLFKQRTRWNQGFLQVLRKGEWRKLPSRRQRSLALYLLIMPFLQALIGLFIPMALLMVLTTRLQPFVAMISFLPLAVTVITLVVEAVGLGEFGRLYRRRVRVRDYAKLVVGMFPYQIFLGAAAIRAVYRQRKGLTGWEKTEHTGAHRPSTAPLHDIALVAAAGAEGRT